MEPVVMVRPLPVRVASAVTLAAICGWAVLNGDLGELGVIAYPAIIALQTTREWLWRLEVSPRGLHERPGIGKPRTLQWRQVSQVLMPDAVWWRVNPALVVADGPNVQMTAAPEVAEVIAIARRRRIEVVGDVGTVSLVRTLAPWMVLLALACLLLASELAGVA